MFGKLKKAALSLLAITLFLPAASLAQTAQSLITESNGRACMSADKTKAQVEQEAVADATQNARRAVLQYLQEQGQDKEIASAYSKGAVRLLEEIEKTWNSNGSEQCCSVTTRAEIIPEVKPARSTTRGIAVVKSGTHPATIQGTQLQVQAWTDKSTYREGQRITLYLRSNKAFYGRIVYSDVAGNLVQLLPNPHRRDNYFAGGNTIHEIPSSRDKFELEVTPPFGTEEIIIYGSTEPLGDIEVQPAGAVYQIKLAYAEIGIKTRGVAGVRPGSSIKSTTGVGLAGGSVSRPQTVAQNTPQAATYAYSLNKNIVEFSERSIVIKTSR